MHAAAVNASPPPAHMARSPPPVLREGGKFGVQGRRGVPQPGALRGERSAIDNGHNRSRTMLATARGCGCASTLRRAFSPIPSARAPRRPQYAPIYLPHTGVRRANDGHSRPEAEKRHACDPGGRLFAHGDTCGIPAIENTPMNPMRDTSAHAAHLPDARKERGWYARRDSNPQPSDPKSDALSN